MSKIEPLVIKIAETKVDEDGVQKMMEKFRATDWYNRVRPSQRNDGEFLIEVAGRSCYKSYGLGLNPNVVKIREDSRDYLSNVLAKGDGSILEHATVTFAFLNISRVTSHEIVRHRAGTAISQESLRYVRPQEISVWVPPDLKAVSSEFERSILEITQRYHELESKFDWDKMTFEEKKRVTSALRRILPDGMATNMVWTANHRTLRWVIEMRTHPSAEVEIRQVFGQVAEICIRDYPLLYADFTKTQLPDGTFQYTPKYSKA